MAKRNKILLLDDDEDLLELYREMLGRLPSEPEVHIATSGARALALLEAEPFGVLISDLNMPRMDGLQVLTIVRRKFPELRTAVMTSVVDEQFRARAYSMGVDLFLEKPNTPQEITFFIDCVESLLDKEEAHGFRGVQSKSLVDIIQLECLSQSSSVLKITNGPSEGRIWLLNGEIIDAVAHDLGGEAAFHRILGWRTGSFEILPAEPARERTIHTSYQNLLLETAQAIDERAPEAQARGGEQGGMRAQPEEESSLARMSRMQGVQFIVATGPDGASGIENWKCENPDQVATWMRSMAKRFSELGDNFQAGQLLRIEAAHPQWSLSLAFREGRSMCVAFDRNISIDLQRETMKVIISSWVS